jgi:hypothetical protein
LASFRIICYCGLRLRKLAQVVHEHAGSGKDQQQAGDEAVNTGGLGQCDTQDHGAGDVALALGLTADSLTGSGGTVTFADTRADTGDQSKTGTDGAASQGDTLAKIVKSINFAS